jgi:phosphoribosylamine-glycine ligase
LLPGDNIDFRNQFVDANGKAKKPKTYIVKPEGLSQGKGIFLSRDLNRILEVCQQDGYVV